MDALGLLLATCDDPLELRWTRPSASHNYVLAPRTTRRPGVSTASRGPSAPMLRAATRNREDMKPDLRY